MAKLSSDRLPAYYRHKRSDQARVFIDGRDILPRRYGIAASRERYNATIAEWLANDRKLPPPAVEVLTLHVIARFSERAKKYSELPPQARWAQRNLSLHPNLSRAAQDECGATRHRAARCRTRIASPSGLRTSWSAPRDGVYQSRTSLLRHIRLLR
jgi:hypothetical protein